MSCSAGDEYGMEEREMQVFEECVEDTREDKAGRAGGDCDREESGK